MWLYKVLSVEVYLTWVQKGGFCPIYVRLFIFPSFWTFHCYPRLHTPPVCHRAPLCAGEPRKETGSDSTKRRELCAPGIARRCGAPQMSALFFLMTMRHLPQTESSIPGLIRGFSFSALGWRKIELSFLHGWNYLHHNTNRTGRATNKSSLF